MSDSEYESEHEQEIKKNMMPIDRTLDRDDIKNIAFEKSMTNIVMVNTVTSK